MKWLWRGALSAAYYYLSCTPYYTWVAARQRKKERLQAQAARANEDPEHGEYTHPVPSDTNPYWTEEMIMGPSLKRGRNSKDKTKSESTKRLNTAGAASSIEEHSLSPFPSLEGLPRLEDASWNKKRYQRPDEYLWGEDDRSVGTYASVNSRAANKPLVSGNSAYYHERDPANSELHPPIISNRPTHANQALWMLQPPPPAKIMEGKERADRSRSVSNASGVGTGGAVAGRNASVRRPISRMQDDLPPNMDPSPPEDYGETGGANGQPYDRPISSLYTNGDIRKKPPPIQITDSPARGTRSRANTTGRPQLSIVNSVNEVDRSLLQPTSGSNRPASPASSLLELQKSAPFESAFDIRPTSSSKDARNTMLPVVTDQEEQILSYTSGLDDKKPYVPAYRWSMDI